MTYPQEVKSRATAQLQTPTFIIGAGLPNAGQPNLGALVQDLEELWHLAYDRGEIKDTSAPRPSPDYVSTCGWHDV